MRVPAPDVSVIIVTARDAPRLSHCLDAVRHADPGLASELVVVLNAAERGMEDAARGAPADVRVVRSDVPLGFAAGVNLGASAARGRYLHVLHDDALVEPGAITALVRALDENPRAGAAGSLLLDPDGTTVQGAGHVLWRDGRTQPPWRGTPPPADTFTDTRVVDYCSSASLLVRADAWRAAGGIDEELHPGQFVDVDLSMRLRACGYLVICAPASRVRHARGGTAGSATRRVAWERNRSRFLAMWAGDLAWQEPFAEDEDALGRAQQATRARARAVSAMTLAPARAAGPAEDPEVRERRALRRDLEFKTACVRELELVDARAGELERELAATRQELQRVHAAHAVEMAHREAFAAERDVLAARVGAQDDAIAHLRQREQVLDGIVAGRWWRLRERLAAVHRRLSR